ncbi:MAG: cellulase family glycosylhydrolase [Phycisphaerae bacterium]|nr:cellulase family glycosylhydrolase [Phycisphaerae bacterium]
MRTKAVNKQTAAIIAIAAACTCGGTQARGQTLAPQSMYGINTHVPTDALIAKCQAGNIGWGRVDLNWFAMETSKGVYSWGAIDAAVNSANARGIRFYATLAYTPSWANGGQDHTVPPTNPNDWKDFVRATVNRYKGSIRHWGLWNEPDLDQFFSGTSSQYINTIVIPGAQAIREADPTALRCAPDLAGDSDFLEDVLNAAKDYIDVVTVHKYDEQVSDIMNKFDGYRWPWEDPNYKTLLQNTGAWGKAVWFTEVGWPTAGGTHVDTVTEAEQANLYVQLLDQVRLRPWINKIFFYELKDDPTSGVPSWGILRADLTEKPAYGAYRDYVAAHPPGQSVTITDLRRYNLATFTLGSAYFADRSYTITSMPAYLQGCQGIQTRNDDAGATSEAWIDFDIDQDADVYIAYDRRASALPDWMGGCTEMAGVIGVSDAAQGYAKLYRMSFSIGEAVLGANMASGATGASSNYFVLVLPAGAGPPARASDPSPADGTTRVPLDTTLSWTAGAGASSHTVYFGTSSPGVFRGNQSATTFDPGPLALSTTYYWRIDEVNAAGTTEGQVWTLRTVSPPGDADGDGDVDQEDFGTFQACYTGRDPGALPPECLFADMDGNGLVDQNDFSMFWACISGPGVLSDPGCDDLPG